MAGNLQLLYFIYKTSAFPREGVLRRLWKNVLEHMAGFTALAKVLRRAGASPGTAPGLSLRGPSGA